MARVSLKTVSRCGFTPWTKEKVVNDTNQGTKDQLIEIGRGVETGELIENNGRPEWTRTIDLFRVNVPS